MSNVKVSFFKNCFGYENPNTTKIDLIFELIRNGDNINNVSQARIIDNKQDKDYLDLKLNSKSITWGFDFIKNKPTGLIYFDCDFSNNEDIKQIKHDLFQFPFIISVWSSFGGRGIGGIAKCSVISNQILYKVAYKSLAKFLNNELGIGIDKHCSDIKRRNTLSFDENILIKTDVQEFNNFNLDEEDNEELKNNITYNLDKYQFDSSLFFDVEIYEKFKSYFEKDFYQKFVLVDKITGMPILYKKGIIYDDSIHDLKVYFEQDVISKIKIRNELATMAIANPDEHFACIKLKLLENTYFPHLQRTKNIVGICINFLKTNTLEKDKITKNLIYNFLYILNKTRCTLKYVDSKKGEKPIMFPISDSEINKLSTFTYNIFKNNEVKIIVDKCKSIRSSNFINLFNVYSGYKGNDKIQYKIIYEINRLKNQSPENKFEKCILDNFEKYPDLMNKDYIEILSKELNINIDYAKNIYYLVKKINTDKKSIKVQHSLPLLYRQRILLIDTFFKSDFLLYKNPAILNPKTITKNKKTIYPSRLPNDIKIKNLILNWKEQGKITQIQIAEKLNCSIITIKRNWTEEIKKLVKDYNNKL